MDEGPPLSEERGDKTSHVVRVLVLTTSFPLGKEEVSGVFVKRLVDHLYPQVNVRVLTPCHDRPLKDAGTELRNVECFRYAPRRLQTLTHKPGGIPAAFSAGRWRLVLVPGLLLSMLVATMRRARGCDIIHANWSVCGLIGGIAGKLLGKPVVTTLRGQDVNLQGKVPLLRLISRFSVRLSSITVCVSESIVKKMVSAYPEYASRIRHIPNGVDPDLLSISRSPSAAGIFRILFAGNLIPVKDPTTLLKAAASLSRHTVIALHILGDGPERELLEHLAADLELSAHTMFHGTLPPSEVPGFLASSDALVLPSLKEGRPNIVLEAMAAGVPVVASDIDGVNELISNNRTGILFPPGNDQSLAEQLERLIRDPDLGTRLAGNARKHIVDAELLWTDSARRYISLYRSLIDGSCVV